MSSCTPSDPVVSRHPKNRQGPHQRQRLKIIHGSDKPRLAAGVRCDGHEGMRLKFRHTQPPSKYLQACIAFMVIRRWSKAHIAIREQDTFQECDSFLMLGWQGAMPQPGVSACGLQLGRRLHNAFLTGFLGHHLWRRARSS